MGHALCHKGCCDERDRLKQEIKDIEANTVSAYSYAHELDLKDKEIDRLKAELEIFHEHNSRCLEMEKALVAEYRLKIWKSKAERLAEALREAIIQANCDGDLCAYAWHEKAKEALAEYEKGV